MYAECRAMAHTGVDLQLQIIESRYFRRLLHQKCHYLELAVELQQQQLQNQ